MVPTEPPRPDPDYAPSGKHVPDADRSWPLAISLLTVWRGADDEQLHSSVAQRLAEIAAEDGPAAVGQAALGLTNLAGMFLEMYANRMSASPDDVLRHAAALNRDLWC